MLQAVNSKPIETKAPKAEAKANAKSAAKDLESQLEGADFNSELEAASMGEEQKDLEVKPVKVSAEQALEIPSELLKLPGSEVSTEGVNPKVFDPALTKGVDKIIQPKTTDIAVPQLTNEQIMQLANAENLSPEAKAELMQAMLKTPQVQVGRSAALDMAQTEIDPQLINMEDFVSQKNAAMKRNLNNANAYGMPQKGQAGKAGMEHGLKSTQTINEIGFSEQGASGMNSQQFILNNQADLGNQLKLNETQTPVKTFNMSHIKTDNPNQIMTQITDYIVQAKAAKEPTVSMRVNHDQLGMIDITVNKMAGNSDAIAINIGAHTVDGKNFFQANSKDLFSHLSTSGLNVSDLKVESSSSTAKSDFDFGGQSGRGSSSSQDKQFGSESNQRRHESERRQDLWKLLNKEAA